jgi:hypothetical protein
MRTTIRIATGKIATLVAKAKKEKGMERARTPRQGLGKEATP